METTLGEHMDAGESKGKTLAPGNAASFVHILPSSDVSLCVGRKDALIAADGTTLHEIARRRRR